MSCGRVGAPVSSLGVCGRPDRAGHWSVRPPVPCGPGAAGGVSGVIRGPCSFTVGGRRHGGRLGTGSVYPSYPPPPFLLHLPNSGSHHTLTHLFPRPETVWISNRCILPILSLDLGMCPPPLLFCPLTRYLDGTMSGGNSLDLKYNFQP